MKEKLKNQKGITLIALIITIIVLLILAMVSIKLVWDGGIIAHAQNAVNAYNEAQTNEMQQLNELTEQMKQYGGGAATIEPMQKWWEFRNGEEEALQYNDSKYFVANKDSNKSVGFLPTGANDKSALAIVVEDYGIVTCLLGDDTVQLVESNGAKVNGDQPIEKYKWYYITSFSDMILDEYTGSSPIQLSDFAENEIFCKSYLERVIASFNN